MVDSISHIRIVLEVLIIVILKAEHSVLLNTPSFTYLECVSILVLKCARSWEYPIPFLSPNASLAIA